MGYFLTSIIIALFCGLLFLNIYFRMKILKSFRYLSQKNIEFNIGHIFNEEKLRTEVLPRYPKDKERIEEFVRQIKRSLKIALVVILGISIAGFLLNFVVR